MQRERKETKRAIWWNGGKTDEKKKKSLLQLKHNYNKQFGKFNPGMDSSLVTFPGPVSINCQFIFYYSNDYLIDYMF